MHSIELEILYVFVYLTPPNDKMIAFMIYVYLESVPLVKWGERS
jgi:1-acyl-sn-glycerol-3-phosphate acyltransferase